MISRSRRKKECLIIIVIIIASLVVQHIYAAHFAVFRGKIIDADTKQPIEGAVVVALWSKERMTIAEGGWSIADVKETLTGKNGEWRIQGASGYDIGSSIIAIITGYGTCFRAGTTALNPPQFIYFKPEYCSVPKGDMLDACKRMKLYEKDGTWILELPKLTNREDRLKNLPDPAGGNRKKQKNFMRLINEESGYLGLEEYPDLGRWK